jgi:hypothetical protein
MGRKNQRESEARHTRYQHLKEDTSAISPQQLVFYFAMLQLYLTVSKFKVLAFM